MITTKKAVGDCITVICPGHNFVNLAGAKNWSVKGDGTLLVHTGDDPATGICARFAAGMWVGVIGGEAK